MNLPVLRRRLALVLAVLAAVVGLYAAAGFLGLPALGRAKLPERLSQALERKVSIDDIAFNPFTLELAVVGLKIAERGAADTAGAPLALGFSRFEAQLSWRSLIERAPVVSAVRLIEPRVHLARGKDGRCHDEDHRGRCGAGRERQ